MQKSALLSRPYAAIGITTIIFHPDCIDAIIPRQNIITRTFRRSNPEVKDWNLFAIVAFVAKTIAKKLLKIFYLHSCNILHIVFK
jgi:hypothetical protein